jgi:hypothetical protein
MSETEHEVEAYLSHIEFPVTREELINGLLVRDAPGRMIALVERLPKARYHERAEVRRDLVEIDQVHARELAGARSYEELLAVVLRNVGDVRYATKETYNRVVQRVIHVAQQQGTLGPAEARAMELRLDATFADLRGTMPEVYDERVPTNPHDDLPRRRE